MEGTRYGRDTTYSAVADHAICQHGQVSKFVILLDVDLHIRHVDWGDQRAIKLELRAADASYRTRRSRPSTVFILHHS